MEFSSQIYVNACVLRLYFKHFKNSFLYNTLLSFLLLISFTYFISIGLSIQRFQLLRASRTYELHPLNLFNLQICPCSKSTIQNIQQILSFKTKSVNSVRDVVSFTAICMLESNYWLFSLFKNFVAHIVLQLPILILYTNEFFVLLKMTCLLN